MTEVEYELLRSIQQGREKILEQVGAGLTKKYRSTVCKLYREQKKEGFTPSVARDLWKEVSKDSRVEQEVGGQLVEEYRKLINSKVEETRKLKDLTLECFSHGELSY